MSNFFLYFFLLILLILIYNLKKIIFHDNMKIITILLNRIV